MSELKQKIQAKFQGGPVLASLATITEDGRPWSRYVVPTMDEDMTLWVATFKQSRKVGQIRKNAEVHLNFGVMDMETAESYLQVEGRAEVLDDIEVKKKVWNDNLKTYFSGPDDPAYVVLKIVPYRVEYNLMQPVAPEIWEA